MQRTRSTANRGRNTIILSTNMNSYNKDPLHGITLEKIVTQLAEHYGWEELGKRINIRCFQADPSVKSSLKFLRKTPWAREKVEQLFIATEHTKNK
jgi:uncharacterized protein (DUF2132 family)